MPDNIIINPITRISGFMEIEAEVENGSVADARIKGMMLRNFEKMMVGRNPFDAVYFTQRICGICSSAHAMASTLALENMMGITPSGQGRYLRDIIHGCEYIQNHIRHFYQLIVPDYVKMPDDFPLFTTGQPDYRLPAEKNAVIVNNYFSSLDISRDAHVMLATLGGKAPHNHGVFIGGLTTQATADKIIQLKSILSRIGTFVNEKMIPDVYEIASYYPDYFNIGGGYGNLLTYGCFDNYADLGTLYVNPLVYANRQISAFDSANITLQTDYSRYDDMTGEPDTAKETAYSWIKAPRYDCAFVNDVRLKK